MDTEYSAAPEDGTFVAQNGFTITAVRILHARHEIATHKKKFYSVTNVAKIKTNVTSSTIEAPLFFGNKYVVPNPFRGKALWHFDGEIQMSCISQFAHERMHWHKCGCLLSGAQPIG